MTSRKSSVNYALVVPVIGMAALIVIALIGAWMMVINARHQAVNVAGPGAPAHYRVGDIMVANPWVRANISGRPAAVFLIIYNRSDQADRLIGARSPLAGRIEIHSHARDGDIMRMRRLEAIDVIAQGTTELRPGGRHLMVFDLDPTVRPGGRLPLVLRFERAGELVLEAPVRALGAPARLP